uniref:Retrotransposon gag domain-containing protein n=1 Tax=Davidia involucrata TaxID=16924 RepID=A0A5B7BCT4_DAVIN
MTAWINSWCTETLSKAKTPLGNPAHDPHPPTEPSFPSLPSWSSLTIRAVRIQPVGFAAPNNSLNSIEQDEQVPLTAYHLEGDVQLWYQLLKDEGETITWTLLKEGLHARFGPTQFKDFFGDLTKLRQIMTVHDYQSQFEKLLTRAGKLTPMQQVCCFTSGLREAIRADVQAAQPTTLGCCRTCQII